MSYHTMHYAHKLLMWPRHVFLDSLREKKIPYKVQWDKQKKDYVFVVQRKNETSKP